MNFLKITKRQIWLIIIVLAVTGMLIDLNTRISTLSYLKEQRSTLESDVARLQTTAEVLEDRINYAGSDAAVEAWARQQGMMMEEGDHVIFPVEGEQAEVTSTPEPVIESTPIPNQEVWRALIFGQ